MNKFRPSIVRDVLYGYITLSPLAKSIIDTPEFQGLRGLRQLGVCHYVFPSANHTRFEHSLGVYHLAGLFLDHLLNVGVLNEPLAPSERISQRTKELIQIAGLTHDIGHTAYSHTFDHEIAPTIGVSSHEERSRAMLQHMWVSNRVDLTPDELQLVIHLILGVRLPGYPAWIFEIVANASTHLDVDKLDYECRDSYYIGLPSVIQVQRIFGFARIVQGHICFHEKIYMQLFDVFITRYRLHKEVYRHPVVVSIELLVVEMMCILAQEEHWENVYQDPQLWRWINDESVLFRCAVSSNERLRHLHSNLVSRRLPIQSTSGDAGIEVTDILGFASSVGPNPLSLLRFYNDENPHVFFHKRPEEVSPMLPVNHYEVRTNNFRVE